MQIFRVACRYLEITIEPSSYILLKKNKETRPRRVGLVFDLSRYITCVLRLYNYYNIYFKIKFLKNRFGQTVYS